MKTPLHSKHLTRIEIQNEGERVMRMLLNWNVVVGISISFLRHEMEMAGNIWIDLSFGASLVGRVRSSGLYFFQSRHDGIIFLELS